MSKQITLLTQQLCDALRAMGIAPEDARRVVIALGVGEVPRVIVEQYADGRAVDLLAVLASMDGNSVDIRRSDPKTSVADALDRVMHQSWDGEESFDYIATRWIEHMATTHGHDCPGKYCPATATESAAAALIKTLYAASGEARTGYQAGYVKALIDLADELGIELP